MAHQSNFGDYQRTIYGAGMLHNVYPTVTTDPNKLEEQAKEHMSKKSWLYIAGGAGERSTMNANRLAFRQWRLIPRFLQDVTTDRDLSVELFGVKYNSPVIMAPIGVQGIFHQDGEKGVASVAKELNVPYILSTAATSSIEEVAEANGDGHRWFQLYWPVTDEVTISLLKRAKENGFTVLVVTLDSFSLSWRPLDLDVGYLPFALGVGNQVGLSDPVFRKVFKEKTGKEVEDDIITASAIWGGDAFSGRSHTWDHLKVLKENWDGPIVLKGIQHVDDARMAVEAGIDGIVVSNHGGRQLDGAIGSLEVLPEIVEAVGDKITVLFDSGIRTGVDIIKALSLGAKAVLLGRPWAYGLGIAGKTGAKQVIQGILADFELSMKLAGIKSVGDCHPGRLRKVAYGGDEKLSS
jgi:lactate 2-monooxygenase